MLSRGHCHKKLMTPIFCCDGAAILIKYIVRLNFMFVYDKTISYDYRLLSGLVAESGTWPVPCPDFKTS